MFLAVAFPIYPIVFALFSPYLFIFANGNRQLNENNNICMNMNISQYTKIEKPSDIPAHVEILLCKTIDDERRISLTVKNYSVDIASDAVLLKIPNGKAFRDWSGVIDKKNNLYYFHQWENLPGKFSDELTTCTKRKVYAGTIMNFLMPWGDVNSHIIATILPKLNFTCNYLLEHPEVKLLANCIQTFNLILTVCPQIQNDRFITFEDDKLMIEADILLYPFFFCPGASSWHMGMYPKNIMKPLGKARLPRTILYMPRPRHAARYLTNEISILAGICDLLSYNSGLELAIFSHQSLSLDKDVLSSARVILSVHSGAMANMIYAPPDVQIIEIIQIEKGNPFYVGLSRVLGLQHTIVAPNSFDHGNVSIPTHVDADSVLNIIKTIPEVQRNPASHMNKLDYEHQKKCHVLVAEKFVKTLR